MRKNVNQLIIALLALLGLPLFGNAQNVTISPSSGNLISGLTEGEEIGFQNGWSSLWLHDQLPLTLTVSDEATLTTSGRLKNPAGNIKLDTDQGLYVIGGGKPYSTHLNISLPKGYRFTRYRIVLLNNLNNAQLYTQDRNVAQQKKLIETDSEFSNAITETDVMGATDDTKEYVIERTSMSETDMSNQLYFYFAHGSNGFYGATIKSIELDFTAEGPFVTPVKPKDEEDIIANGQNIVRSPFFTDKIDLGPITNNTKGDQTYLSYNYNNVTDLTAYNALYQADAVTADNKLPADAGTGSIQALYNSGDYYYAVGNNTYYVETPTTAKTLAGVDVPIGYRIVGATVTYNYGAKEYYISATTQGGTTYYLQENGYWDTTPVPWQYADGKLKSGNYYLRVTEGGWFNPYYYITNTTNVSEASDFTLDETNKRVSYNGQYIYLHSTSNRARLTTSINSAATLSSGNSNNPSFTPGAYTLKVYGTDKDNPVEEVNVSSDNATGTVELTGLNNDAVKFVVEDLAGDAKALVQVSLKLEALNPFINSLDIVCHSYVDNAPTLTQQFSSNDFRVAGGQFDFYVPTEFMGDDKKCYFTFENLFSKYGDSTYPDGSADHNSRYFFVNSTYWDGGDGKESHGDGKQYTATGDEPYSDKSSTTKCGTVPFKFSNADEVKAGTEGVTTSLSLEEYPFSEAEYIKQGGGFEDNAVINIAEKDSDAFYLFTGDETRYNLAPTTALEHRSFAYYEMRLKVIIKDFDAKCVLTPIYTTTCYNGDGKLQELPMYGGKFVAMEKGTTNELPAGKAYLTVKAMKEALLQALRDLNQTPDTATGKQILYLDYTNMYSVHLPEKAEMDAMKAKLNPNCLFYFPSTTFWNDDNFAQKTSGGAFLACRNIVLKDKYPFYAPFKISVPATNYATYTREVTVQKNGTVKLASVILPFTITTENGIHTNPDNSCSFKVTQMKSDGSLSLAPSEDGKENYYNQAQFVPYEGKETVANTPYMIEVQNEPEGDNVSFIALQYGSDVEASTGMADDYTFTGETATGTLSGTTYTFTNHGSYSGKKIAKGSAKVFYFSRGKFVNLDELDSSYGAVKIAPFRAYYEYNTSTGTKGMSNFNVTFDDPIITGIDEVLKENAADLKVVSGSGMLTITSSKDQAVTITSLSGARVNRVEVGAGETKSVALPAGVYIINGVKVIVK